MCGIMGYVGKRGAQNASTVIMNGLTRQEYRGYDSTGVAFHRGAGFDVTKIVGRVSELAKKLEARAEIYPPARTGIGHTRWATHGGVTETNAHPHVSAGGMVALVHNGIVENAKEIRAGLEATGTQFITETDTEAACQLLGHLYTGEPLRAITRLCASLQGAFAFVVLFRDRPEEIWCARKGSPLVAAAAGGAGYCASDPTALLEYTHDLFFMDEGEIARIDAGRCSFFDFQGTPREKAAIRLDWDSVMTDKGPYDHFMRKEIGEQPDVLRHTVDAHTTVTSVNMEKDVTLPREAIRRIRRVHFVACGTSHYATLVAANVMESLDCDLDIRAEIASEYRYRNVPGGDDTLAVLVSQSGETADTLAAARLARSKGTHCIAVTNARGSTIDREIQHTLLSLAGPEIGVAATKTFMGQIGALTLLALHLLKERGGLRAGDEARLVAGLRALPSKIQGLLNRETDYIPIAEKYMNASGFFFIGRRECVPLAMEGALKLKEIAYLSSEAYAAGEMKHGPIAMLDENLPVVAIVPNSELREKTLSNVEECRARKAPIIMLATEGDEDAREYANDIIYLPKTEPELIPFVGVVPLQLFAYHTAKALGRDIDMPRNLAKSVTVE